jgi:hypothetical protein
MVEGIVEHLVADIMSHTIAILDSVGESNNLTSRNPTNNYQDHFSKSHRRTSSNLSAKPVNLLKFNNRTFSSPTTKPDFMKYNNSTRYMWPSKISLSKAMCPISEINSTTNSLRSSTCHECVAAWRIGEELEKNWRIST